MLWNNLTIHKNRFMKQKLFLISLIFISVDYIYSQVIVTEGNYFGKPLCISNPPSGMKYEEDNLLCIDSLFVNNKLINSDSLETEIVVVRFKDLGIDLGEKIITKIHHKEDCFPKILVDIGSPKSPFQWNGLEVDSKQFKGKITSYNENGAVYVEQFKDYEWVALGEIDYSTLGSSGSFTYNVLHHKGLNRYRLKYIDVIQKPRFTPTIEYNNTNEAQLK